MDSMLEVEKVDVRMIAWDKPTAKSMSFALKYYGLSAHVPQPNNFVVFEDYWKQ